MGESKVKTLGPSRSSMKGTKSPFSIVAIGASAGGIEALEHFFGNVPEDFCHSFVVVQHLSPDHKSMMADLLAKYTHLSVFEVTHEMDLEPCAVYVSTPGKNLTLKGERLCPVDIPDDAPINFPINFFMESLARECNESAVGIILSGTGSDGTHGVQAIKEVGGLVLVQDPITAGFDGMPLSAIATGSQDHVLAPDEMPAQLSRYLSSPLEHLFHPVLPSDEQQAFERILSRLHKQTQIDFHQYKRPTLMRRLKRRLVINHCHSLEDYAEILDLNPSEGLVLNRDFLIGVTRFFRDKEAWDIIVRDVVPQILQRKQPNQPLKVWSLGCSSGEEAYTLAIVLDDVVQRLNLDIEIKVFATDVEKENVEWGSRGMYPTGIESELSMEHLQRYFVRHGSQYKVLPHLRKMVIFSKHNSLVDPPFGQMDLVVCRNLLIYLKPDAQRRLVNTMHYALNLHGFLFLGPSESLGDSSQHFKEVSRRWRIYCNRESGRALDRLTNANTLGRKSTPARGLHVQMEMSMSDVLVRTLLGELNAACIYVDKAFDVIHAVGDYTEYVSLPKGKLSFNLLKMSCESLRLGLTTAVHKAQRLNKQVLLSDIWQELPDQSRRQIQLVVSPFTLIGHNDTSYAIVFLPRPIEEGIPDAEYHPIALDVEMEAGALKIALQEAQANLESTLVEAQTRKEELQVTNEELMASNEELQSTNEELQSLNEELHTVNTEYQLKIEELAALNDDMDNLLSSTQIGTIFLDTELRIRSYTPAVQSQFALLPSDLGRPITHLAGKLKDSDVQTLRTRVLEVQTTGEPQEREIQTEDESHYLERITPFVNAEHVIGGTVLTFVDITELKKVEEQVRYNEQLLIDAEEIANLGSWELDISTGVSVWSEQMFRVCGFEPFAFLPSEESWIELIHPEDQANVVAAFTSAKTTGLPFEVEMRMIGPDDSIRYAISRGRVLRDNRGLPRRLRGTLLDVTQQKTNETALLEAQQQFKIFFDHAPVGKSITRTDGTFMEVNQSFASMLGYDVDELSNIHFSVITHPEDKHESAEIVRRLLGGENSTGTLEKRYIRSDGSIIWTHVTTAIHRDLDNNPLYFLTHITDITESKAAEEMKERFASILNASNDLISFVDRNYVYRAVNPSYLDYWQIDEDTIVSKHVADVVGNDKFESIVRPMLDRCFSKEVIRYQDWFAFPGPGRRYMDVFYHPVVSETDKVTGAAVSIRDITTLKKQELELTKALDLLQKSNVEMEQFAYIASHDLQEPLNTITNFIYLLQKKYSEHLDEQGNTFLDIITSGAARMKELIHALLRYSRLRSSVVECENFMFVDLLDEVKANLIDLINNTQAKIHLTGQAELYGDHTLLRQLLQNLLINGMKFQKPNQTPELRIMVVNEPNHVLVSVNDNGIGIATEHTKKIFGIFRRLHSQVEFQGTGLGLALCMQIVEMHGGEIWLESTPDVGSTFFFTLPNR